MESLNLQEGSFIDRQYVVFKLGVETFGLDINKVKEIILYQIPTQLPCSLNYFEGVINLRGFVIPIVNLKAKFGLSSDENTKDKRIVVVETNCNVIGIVVDKVTEVVMIPVNVIEKPSSIISSAVNEDYISGVAKMESGLIILLDLKSVLETYVSLTEASGI